MFFRPANSLILIYDPLKLDDLETFQTQIQEVRKFYRAVFLSEVFKMGSVAVVLSQARKRALMHWVPYLLEQEIPFTLGLDSDCIGMNRLPRREENELRSENGVLDLNHLDPMRYFTTWGKLVELPPKLWEPALSPQTLNMEDWKESIGFVEFHLKRRPISCIFPENSEGKSPSRTECEKLGISFVLGTATGAVDKKTSRLFLPRWQIQP